jgi:hypothetical protein
MLCTIAVQGVSVSRQAKTLNVLQIAACGLGMLAGFVPGISFTGLFTGMDYMSGGFAVAAGDERVRVTGVEQGSSAERAGFRAGDIIKTPETFDAERAAVDAVNKGETRVFNVKRGETEVKIEPARTKPEIAAIWYAHLWYPIAGALFLCLGILLFATETLDPVPMWRSITAIVVGLGIAAGFGLT